MCKIGFIVAAKCFVEDFPLDLENLNCHKNKVQCDHAL